MTTSHLRLEGGWAKCPEPESCELKFHVPGMTPAEVEALPASMLGSLLEAADPPTTGAKGDSQAKTWLAPHPRTGELQLHRDYDLPAVVHADGTREWYQRGERQRLGDNPAMVRAGTEAWYFAGLRHRNWGRPAGLLKDEHGKVLARAWFFMGFEHRLFGPAVIEEDGSKEWWLFGRQVWPRGDANEPW